MTPIDKIVSMLKQFIVDHFYGKLILSFEAGKLVHIEKRESIKV